MQCTMQTLLGSYSSECKSLGISGFSSVSQASEKESPTGMKISWKNFRADRGSLSHGSHSVSSSGFGSHGHCMIRVGCFLAVTTICSLVKHCVGGTSMVALKDGCLERPGFEIGRSTSGWSISSGLNVVPQLCLSIRALCRSIARNDPTLHARTPGMIDPADRWRGRFSRSSKT
jgi:hypothetical protein